MVPGGLFYFIFVIVLFGAEQMPFGMNAVMEQLLKQGSIMMFFIKLQVL